MSQHLIKVLTVIRGIIISHLPHRESSRKCQTTGIQTHHLFMVSCCLLPYCCHFNKFNKVSVYVCKDATSETKANSKADVPNEENMAREGGIIQLVSGKVNVLYAYIIQGECELTTPSLSLHDNTLAGAGRLFCHKHCCFHHPFCASSRHPGCTTVGQKLFVRFLFISRQPSVPCSSAAAGVFSVHGTGW